MGKGGGGGGWWGANKVYHRQCTNDEFLYTVSIEDHYHACITSIAVV